MVLWLYKDERGELVLGSRAVSRRRVGERDGSSGCVSNGNMIVWMSERCWYGCGGFWTSYVDKRGSRMCFGGLGFDLEV